VYAETTSGGHAVEAVTSAFGVGVYSDAPASGYSFYGTGPSYLESHLTVLGQITTVEGIVSYGANDSGGAGYKVLRVPN
jgi:hypothetical protein